MTELSRGMYQSFFITRQTRNKILTTDEIALYDRQIRLWGVNTQVRLSTAKILVINASAVGMEIIKNLVLGGINTIDISDVSVVKSEDFSAQFFLPNDESIIGQTKLPLVIDNIKDLNNRVTINPHTQYFQEWERVKFKKYDLIIGTELNKQEIIAINDISRQFRIPLYVVGLHGMFGYIFTDLIEHESVVERKIGNQPTMANSVLNINKVITDVTTKDDKEFITIKDTYHYIEEIFQSKNLSSQLSRRRMKNLSPALPIILTLLDFPRTAIDSAHLQHQLCLTCDALGISPQVISQQYIDDFSKQAFTEFAPCSAILGGCLAQDVIQYLSKKNSPINNVLILDGIKPQMPIFSL